MEQEAREREREKEARAAQNLLTGLAPPASSSNTAENSKYN